ncbi:MAG: hypothetical protein AB2776_10110 [Candidatus Thiodiazotropha endolucinida]
MMPMNEPELNIIDMLTACINGVRRNTYKQQLIDAEYEFEQQSNNYRTLGEQGNLFQIKPLVTNRTENSVVLAGLTKRDMIRLYEYYLREKDIGRELYNTLLASTDKCPFCGGLGRSRNLDHYLPKAFFSQFSILPYNLIPACRDCNMEGKNTNYAQTQEDQILHPFLDQPYFFCQQWIFANYTHGTLSEPGVFDFYTSPPDEWNDIDKARVNKHFSDFDISIRYSLRAAEEISDVLAQMEYFSNIDEFKSTNLEPVIENAPFANYWKRVMYIGLMNSL